MDFFNIHWFPWHALLSIVSIFEIKTWIDAFLGGLARCIKCKSFVHIDLRIDTEMVTRGNENRTRLENKVSAFFLHLSQLRMSSATIDDLREVLFLFSVREHDTVTFCLEPCKRAA